MKYREWVYKQALFDNMDEFCKQDLHQEALNISEQNGRDQPTRNDYIDTYLEIFLNEVGPIHNLDGVY